MDLEVIKDIINSEGARFYDSELVNENGHSIFRIYITQKDGVHLDTCAKISNIISPILDFDPPTKAKYFLEVSSPGLERKLNNPQHFANSIGELVRVYLVNTQTIEGKLLEADEKFIVIECKNEQIRVSYDEIRKAKTYVIW